MTKEETINYDLFNKFNNNHIVDSIIGKGEFFIADYTYRSHHDSLLVLNQLSIWAKRNNKTHELLNYIKKSFTELKNEKDVYGLVQLLNSIYTIFHFKIGSYEKVLNFEELLEEVSNFIDQNPIKDDEIKRIFDSICRDKEKDLKS